MMMIYSYVHKDREPSSHELNISPVIQIYNMYTAWQSSLVLGILGRARKVPTAFSGSNLGFRHSSPKGYYTNSPQFGSFNRKKIARATGSQFNFAASMQHIISFSEKRSYSSWSKGLELCSDHFPSQFCQPGVSIRILLFGQMKLAPLNGKESALSSARWQHLSRLKASAFVSL